MTTLTLHGGPADGKSCLLRYKGIKHVWWPAKRRNGSVALAVYDATSGKFKGWNK